MRYEEVVRELQRLHDEQSGSNEYSDASKDAFAIALRLVRRMTPLTIRPRMGTVTVTGAVRVRWIAGELVKYSMWFLIEPLPDDAWEVSVKVEEIDRLRHIIREAG